MPEELAVTVPLAISKQQQSIDWQLSVKSDFARDICEIAYKFGEPARVRQEHFPNFLGPKSDHNGFFYGR